jgi:hypothetical protein
MAEELRSISGPEREQAYEELHGVFTGSNYATFEETPELVETSLALLALELEQIPIRHKRAFHRAIFLKPALTRDRSLALMFLRADRFHVAAAAQRLCRFFEEKRRLFGDAKLTSNITLDDLTDADISSIFNGAGHLLLQKDRSGRMVFFVDYLFLDYQDWTNVVRCATTLLDLAMSGIYVKWNWKGRTHSEIFSHDCFLFFFLDRIVCVGIWLCQWWNRMKRYRNRVLSKYFLPMEP